MGGTFSYTEFSVESRVDVKIYFLVACRTLGYIDTLFCNQRVEYVAFAKYLRNALQYYAVRIKYKSFALKF